MAIITWSEQLSVKINEFDQQHKKLIDMINNLFDAMKSGKANTILSDILKGLIDYTKMHFSTEERYMQQFQYPEMAQHKLEHQKLTEKVLAFQKQFQEGKTTISIEVMNFLKDWLMNHISGTDKKYSAFFNQKGLK